MLNIVAVLKEQKAFLYSIIELFRVITDYKNLVGFLVVKKLNWRQIRWVKKLIEYHFKIKYIRRTKNIKVNILNRKAEL